MQKNLIVVDDFYSEPFSIREKALAFDYYKNLGSAYFLRSKPYITLELISSIESLFGKTLDLEDGNWDASSVYNGSFYVLDSTKTPPSHIHHDQHDWVGVVSLDTTPAINKIVPDATCFWTHLRTGRSAAKTIKEIDPLSYEGNNLHSWQLTDQVVHAFNRAIFYPGERFHSAKIGSVARISQLFSFSFK